MPALLLAIAVLLGACAGASDPARDIENRLYAPCCWKQTLADHESPTATALRAEIASRVAAGETPAAIEQSLVERYGERIMAVGPGGDRRGYIGGIAAGIIVLGFVAIVVILRRRRVPAPPAPRREAPEDTERLDDELAAMTD